MFFPTLPNLFNHFYFFDFLGGEATLERIMALKRAASAYVVLAEALQKMIHEGVRPSADDWYISEREMSLLAYIAQSETGGETGSIRFHIAMPGWHMEVSDLESGFWGLSPHLAGDPFYDIGVTFRKAIIAFRSFWGLKASPAQVVSAPSRP